MNQTQSIIVYRNPLEQHLWENPGSFFPIIVGIFVFFLVFGCLQVYVIERLTSSFSGKRDTYTNLALVVSAAAGIAAVMYMV